MMKASGGFGTRWMTDLINNIVKEGCIPGERVSRCLCRRGKVIHLCAVHTEQLIVDEETYGCVELLLSGSHT